MTVQTTGNPISLGLILVIAGWIAIIVSIVASAPGWMPLVGIALLISSLKFG